MRGGDAGSRASFGTLLQKKSGFLGAVFLTLIVQLAIVWGVMYGVAANEAASAFVLRAWLGIFIGLLVIVLILVFVPMPVPVKLLLFTVYSTLLGSTFSFLIRRYGYAGIRTAIVAALGIFVGMLLVGFVVTASGIHLGFMGIYLMAGLIGALVASLVLMFMPSASGSTARKVLSGFMIVLFSLYVAFDTNMILQRDYCGDYATAAFDYFLDVVNLFTNLARLQE